MAHVFSPMLGAVAMRLAATALLAIPWDSGIAGVVGTGTPASCTQAALQTQLDAGGLVTFSCGGAATIGVDGLLIDSTRAVTVDGGGSITLDGGGAHRILSIDGGKGALPTITLRNLAFANGRQSAIGRTGGAVSNQGVLLIENATFKGNRAPFGGAIFSSHCASFDGVAPCAVATLTIRNSTFTDNSTVDRDFAGGAIAVVGGTLAVSDSTFTSNLSGDGAASYGSGGAIFITFFDVPVSATIARSTFDGNRALSSGGAIYVEQLGPGGTLSITNSTFNGNQAGGGNSFVGYGGAIAIDRHAPTTLAHNTIAGNVATKGAGGIALYESVPSTFTGNIFSANAGGNCDFDDSISPADAGSNLQFGDSSCTGVPIKDPLLGPLAANGGATKTMALGTGSPAIDAGGAACPATDQRGVARPDGAACDVGAFEYRSGLLPSGAFQGLWWAAPGGVEAGWGINFAHQGDIVFATWFTFGADNQPQWYVIRADKTATNVYAGPVSSFTGPPFSSVPFPANANVRTLVGTATITFSEDGRSATFTYTVNGVAQTKQIVPQVFAQPVPTCVWGAQADLTLATNYQDLWWVADGQESGWGINFTHQGNIIFATWFTYDANGKAWWLAVVAAGTAVPKVYSGLLKAVTGPSFDAVPFDPNAVVRTTVGNATITVVDGNHAQFDYTLNGVTQSKNLKRQVFAVPGTACQ